MPNVDQCPHCETSISDEDARDGRLWQEFCQTELATSLVKKEDRWFFAGAVVVILAFFVGIFFVSFKNVLSVWFLGFVFGVGLITLFWSLYYQRKRKKAFGEFKKLRVA